MAFDLSTLSPAEQEKILSGPALPPPGNAESNFDNPPNRSIIPEAVIPICLILVISTLLLRAYSRFVVLKTVRLGDFLIFLAFVTYVGYIYCIYDVVRDVGFFVHQWNITVRHMSDVQYILHIGAGFYTFTLLFSKAAILLQWLEIFSPKGTHRPFFWICHVLLWINILFYVSALVAGNLICMPFQRIYDKTVPGYCWNGRPLNLAIGSFNVISDFLLLLLPQRAIWTLNMPTKKKAGIALIFAIGIIACASASLRLGLTVGYSTDPDWLYRVAGLSMGCVVEMTCILLVYCMPGIPAAFKNSTILGTFFRSFRSSLRSISRLRSRSGSVSNISGHDAKKHSRQDGWQEMELDQISVGQTHPAGVYPEESVERLQARV